MTEYRSISPKEDRFGLIHFLDPKADSVHAAQFSKTASDTRRLATGLLPLGAGKDRIPEGQPV